MSTKNKDKLRATSSDFIQQMIKKVQEKEEPASPLAPLVDTKKIEQITNDLKAKRAEKSSAKNYWEKKGK